MQAPHTEMFSDQMSKMNDAVNSKSSGTALLMYEIKPRCRPTIAGAPSISITHAIILLKGNSFSLKNIPLL